MDSLSFRVVRPMNQLTQLALFRHLKRGSERLTAFNAKLLQRYALLDYVDHQTMLALLIDKTQQPLSSLSFTGLRQTLQAVHRFPLDFEAEKRAFEAAFLEMVLAAPQDTLSSVECGALCSFATQITAWDDVLQLLKTFPLQSSLLHQSEREFRVLLDQILLVGFSFSSPAATSSPSSPPVKKDADGQRHQRGVELLEGLVGREMALRRSLNGIIGHDACWTERESAVPTFIGVVHALGCWPQEDIPDADAWKRLALRPSSFHDVDLHQLLRLLVRLHSPPVPNYIRESLEEAVSDDLWRCYTELPNEPVAVFFTNSALWPRVPTHLRKAGGGIGKTSATGVDSKIDLDGTFRRLHEHAVEKQLRNDGPPLSLPVLINLLVSGAFLHVQQDLTEAILSALRNSLPTSPSSCVTSLQASVIATALYQIQNPSEELGAPTQVLSVKASEDVEAIGKLLVPVLQQAHLKQHGSARCVARLLCDCPCWTRQWGLEEGCFNLLREHARDGFTKLQLQGFLDHDCSGSLTLPSDVREIITQCASELPNR